MQHFAELVTAVQEEKLDTVEQMLNKDNNSYSRLLDTYTDGACLLAYL